MMTSSAQIARVRSARFVNLREPSRWRLVIQPFAYLVPIWLLATSSTATPPTPSLALDQWLFKPGDQANWCDLECDDHVWRKLDSDLQWEQQGFADYDGYAWYRLHLSIPAGWKKHPDFRQRQALNLFLGRIDDVDQTWFNAALVGATGSPPPNFQPDWLSPRNYVIPGNLIRWDGDNVIAIRVFDGDGDGGLYSGDCALTIASWGDLIDLTIELAGDRGLTERGSDLPLSASIKNPTNEVIRGTATWSIHSDEGALLWEFSEPSEIPAKSSLFLKQRFTPGNPGFFRVTCTFKAGRLGWSTSEVMTRGFRPEEIVAPLTRAPDFEQFWLETKEALAAVPAGISMEHHPQRDTTSHRVYGVTMRSLGKVRVAGWYEQPRAPGPHPALLRLPGYTMDMRASGRHEAIAIFSFNIRGHGNSQSDVSGTPQDYWIRGLDAKEGYFYQGAYSDCLRAVDFLCSRDEVDPERIGVTGTSQGGGLSLATAALDPRITLCAPDIPFLCNWEAYFKTSQWPEMEKWINAEPERTWERTLDTMSYFDCLNLAAQIRCPVFLGLGLQDQTCPPTTIFAVYNRLRGQKQFHIYPRAKHRVGSGHEQLRYAWISEQFGL